MEKYSQYALDELNQKKEFETDLFKVLTSLEEMTPIFESDTSYEKSHKNMVLRNINEVLDLYANTEDIYEFIDNANNYIKNLFEIVSLETANDINEGGMNGLYMFAFILKTMFKKFEVTE